MSAWVAVPALLGIVGFGVSLLSAHVRLDRLEQETRRRAAEFRLLEKLIGERWEERP